ncbi:lysozyme inhibitor LprI family protein [Falsirhodobacter sp. 20TX0035]|uniref:lysozyme inhibitor LprI family protein n=1 Tax=Falsirhodobacter sp. 20TX0035 TaxID=3022019 RepID=UPI00232E292E|nr:lysozyme inhibitor LprI family protein [Falsirhodobacter sp. 20TX0035]MDB6455059.1 lysozyme inhibitor LprI family protein [Falsirhodobacter sp. 20TX0035]
MIFRAFVLAMLPAAAMAQDCDQATTQGEMTRCAGIALEAADKALNEAWVPAMGRMHAVDDGLAADRQGAAEALRAAQKGWITLRDKGCAAEAWSYAGGSLQPMVEAQCRTRMTEARTAELRDLARRPDQ